jgi:hypothetical protein
VPAPLEQDQLRSPDAPPQPLRLRRRAEEVVPAGQDERGDIDLAEARRHVAARHQLPAAGIGRGAPDRLTEEPPSARGIDGAKAEAGGHELLVPREAGVVRGHVEEGRDQLGAGASPPELRQQLVEVVPRRRRTDQDEVAQMDRMVQRRAARA